MKLIAVAGALCALAWCSDAQAYRTAADLSDFDGASRVRWALDTIEYRVHEHGVPGLFFGDVVVTAEEMLKTWSSPNCTGVYFEYSGSTSNPATPEDGENTIQWLTSGWEKQGFDPNASGITDILYERSDSGEWHIIEADLYVNAQNFDWILAGTPPEGKREVGSVLLHEAGHMLGLLHPCEVDGVDGAPDCDSSDEFGNDAMNPLYVPGQTELSPDDEEGVCFLYPGADCAESGCPDGMTCRDGDCLPECFGDVCAQDEVCTSEGCKPPACTGAECSRPKSCATQADCEDKLECRDGACLPGTRPNGDPCEAHYQCRARACLDGYCVPSCTSDADCSDVGLGVCSLEGSESYCESVARAFGEACSSASECLGDKCVSVESSGPGRCSRSCGSGTEPCPLGWKCGDADGEAVCLPPSEVGCGCRIGSRQSSPSLAGCVALLGLALVWRRRRYRISAAPSPMQTKEAHRVSNGDKQ